MLARHFKGAARTRGLSRMSPLLFALALGGCPSGPVPREGPEGTPRAASGEPSTPRAAQPDEPSALPPGHPPLQPSALPSGHPDIASAGLDDTEAPAPAGPLSVPPVAGITWDTPAGFVAQAPSNSMRVAEYASADGRVSLAVFHFPEMRETVRANIERWKGQFDERAREASRVETRGVAGLSVTTLDIEGANAGMHAGAATDAAPHQRMLGAAVNAPGGFVFFKAVGDAEAVAALQPSFEALIASLRPSGATPTEGTD